MFSTLVIEIELVWCLGYRSIYYDFEKLFCVLPELPCSMNDGLKWKNYESLLQYCPAVSLSNNITHIHKYIIIAITYFCNIIGTQ